MSQGLPVADLRTAVAARVASVTGLAGESLVLYDFLRQPSHSPVHARFAIHAGPTAPLSDRQKPADGVLSTTEIRVMFPWQLSTKDQVTSLGEMLAIQALIRNVLIVVGWDPRLQCRLGSQDYTAGADGWLWSEQSFSAFHLLPLQ